jgi:hypothetical protein
MFKESVTMSTVNFAARFRLKDVSPVKTKTIDGNLATASSSITAPFSSGTTGIGKIISNGYLDDNDALLSNMSAFSGGMSYGLSSLSGDSPLKMMYDLTRDAKTDIARSLKQSYKQTIDLIQQSRQPKQKLLMNQPVYRAPRLPNDSFKFNRHKGL